MEAIHHPAASDERGKYLFREESSKLNQCPTCRKYSTCKSLCYRAECYVSQDEIKLRELPIGVPRYLNHPWPETAKPIKLTYRERQVLWLSQGGFSREEISKTLRVSRDAVKTYIHKLNKKVFNREQLAVNESSC